MTPTENRAYVNKPQAPLTAQGAIQNHAGVHDSTASSGFRVGALTSHATDTKSQHDRILTALRRGACSTDELRAIGIYQVSARIFGLRALGYDIRTDLFSDFSTDGLFHQRMARYSLIEPTTHWREDAASRRR